MGYSIPEPALEMVRLDAAGRVVEVVKPEVWSDQEVLGCSAWAVQGTTLVELTWARIDNESPNPSQYPIAEGLVEEFDAEHPHFTVELSSEYKEKTETEIILQILKSIVAKFTNDQ